MFKKIFFYTILSASVGLNLYLFTVEEKEIDNLDQTPEIKIDKIKLAQSAIKKSQMHANQKAKNIKQIKESILLNQQESTEDKSEIKEAISPDYEQNYEKAKNNWNEEIRAYFEVDLGLMPEQVDKYIELARDREIEISKMMDETFKKSDLNPDEPYLFTLEDNINLGKINQKYSIELRRIIGAEAYNQYVKQRNKMAMKMIKDGHGFIVEF